MMVRLIGRAYLARQVACVSVALFGVVSCSDKKSAVDEEREAAVREKKKRLAAMLAAKAADPSDHPATSSLAADPPAFDSTIPATAELAAKRAIDLYYELMSEFNDAYGEGTGGDCDNRLARVKTTLARKTQQRDFLITLLEKPGVAKLAKKRIGEPEYKSEHDRIYQRWISTFIDGSMVSCGTKGIWDDVVAHPVALTIGKHAPDGSE